MSFNLNNVHEFTEANDSFSMSHTHEHGSCLEENLESFYATIGDANIPTFALRAAQGEPRSTLPDGKMPGVRCPRCAEQGIEQFVLSGKRCPKCNHQC